MSATVGRSRRAARVTAWLRGQITSGAWPEGSQIPTEPELASMLGVGRSSVREAVRSLASLGILEAAPGRGTFVRSVSPVSTVLTDYLSGKDIRDILGVRRTLEIEAARAAATSISNEDLQALRDAHQTEKDAFDHERRLQDPPGPFHIALFQASDNPLLLELYSGLAHAVRQAIDEGLVTSCPPDEKISDHARILRAVEHGDVVEAVHAANDHGDRDLVLSTRHSRPTDVGADTTAPSERPESLRTHGRYRTIDRSDRERPRVRVFRTGDAPIATESNPIDPSNQGTVTDADPFAIR